MLYPDVTPEDAAQVVLPHDDGRSRAIAGGGVTIEGRTGQSQD
jgi:hypothetical protein